jgi:hypothetical protein
MKMHPSRNEMQHRAAEALKLLLAQVSTIKLREIRNESEGKSPSEGFVAHVDVFGRRHLLACEVMSGGKLLDLEKQLEELHECAAGFGDGATPVLIAPRLSPEEQAICKARAAGFLDLEGNARIAVGEVFIGRRTLGSRKYERPAVFIAETFDALASTAVQDSPRKSYRAARAVHPAQQASSTVAMA